MAVSITVCNLALGELRAQPIVDISEDTIEARECARYYPQCLKVLLEHHEWSLANRQATLAALTTNDRDTEWLYAYTLPTDCAKPLRLVTPLGITPGERYYWPFDYPAPSDWWQMWIVEGRTLYSQIPDVVLEYSANDIDEASMSALFVDALAYSLASRLAIPIRDSRDTKVSMLQQAEIATQRAVAEDRNRQPQRDMQIEDEVSLARSGGFTGWPVR